MGLLSFIKEAGQKLFNRAPDKPDATSAPNDVATLNNTAARAIESYIHSQNLSAENLKVEFDANTSTVTVRGIAPDQATREKIILCCGNVTSVEHVNDQMTVAGSTKADTEARFYTVKSGDTLSKISREMYGDANRYMSIFEANKPMLSDPDKIYPGQMLRIPAQA